MLFVVGCFLSFLTGRLVSRLNLVSKFLESACIFGVGAGLAHLGGRLYITEGLPSLGGWTSGQADGGINDNFKSIFFAVLIVVTLIVALSTTIVAKRVTFLSFAILFGLALATLGNLQGFALLTLTILFFILISKKATLLVRASILMNFAVYLLLVLSQPQWLVRDSSIRERLLLAQEAIRHVNSAPWFEPNFIRISQLDFTKQTLTTNPSIKFWVDDVHNFYLQQVNTVGLVNFVIIVVLIALFFVFTSRKEFLRSIKLEEQLLLALCFAFLVILLITMGTLFYVYIVTIFFGLICNRLRNPHSEDVEDRKNLNVRGLRTRFNHTNMVSVLAIIPIFIVAAVTLNRIALDLMSQDKFSAAIQRSSPNDFSNIGWALERNSLQYSNDLRYLYEVSRFLTNSSVCDPAKEVAEILSEKAPGHFLSREALELSRECR